MQLTCNPEDMSVYFDATAAIPPTNVLDNDSSGSHPLVDGPQVAGLSPDNGATGVSERTATLAENKLSAERDHSMEGDSGSHNDFTPGLRRRRQGDKYATDTAQLGLRFQRRRRHNAGPYDDTDGGANGCAPLEDVSPLTPGNEERGVPSFLIGERPSGGPEDTSSDSNDSPPAQIPVPPPGDPPKPELPSRLKRYVNQDRKNGTDRD
jgi:hypothetical protein